MVGPVDVVGKTLKHTDEYGVTLVMLVVCFGVLLFIGWRTMNKDGKCYEKLLEINKEHNAEIKLFVDKFEMLTSKCVLVMEKQTEATNRLTELIKAFIDKRE